MASVNYYPLWDLLRRKEMLLKDLYPVISSTTVSKMKRNEPVSVEIVARVCNYLDCEIQDVCEVEKEKKEEKGK
jgi:DNA-binding Xre family transcriptional regulator